MSPAAPKTVRIPDDLCARIDAARGDVPRQRWCERAFEAALNPVVNLMQMSTAAHRDRHVAASGLGKGPTLPQPKGGKT